MVLTIDSSESLQEAVGYLHDADYPVASIIHDRNEKTFTMRILREAWEDAGPKQRFWLMFTRRSIPIIESYLTFLNVESLQVEGPKDIDWDIVVDIEYDERQRLLRILSGCGTTITLAVWPLRGRLEDAATTPSDYVTEVGILGLFHWYKKSTTWRGTSARL